MWCGHLGLWDEGRDEGATNGKMKGLQAYSRRIGAAIEPVVELTESSSDYDDSSTNLSIGYRRGIGRAWWVIISVCCLLSTAKEQI